MSRKGRRTKERRQQSKLQRFELTIDEVKAIVDRAKAALSAEDHSKLKAAMDTLAFITREPASPRPGAPAYPPEGQRGPVGDVFVSLIHRAELNEVEPSGYLVALLRHGEDADKAPADWMPWNYQHALVRRRASTDRLLGKT